MEWRALACGLQCVAFGARGPRGASITTASYASARGARPLRAACAMVQARWARAPIGRACRCLAIRRASTGDRVSHPPPPNCHSAPRRAIGRHTTPRAPHSVPPGSTQVHSVPQASTPVYSSPLESTQVHVSVRNVSMPARACPTARDDASTPRQQARSAAARHRRPTGPARQPRADHRIDRRPETPGDHRAARG